MAYKKPLYEEVKNTLDNVGKGMCLAKWTQVTTHLHTGHNHSCHHPNTHKVSEAEIARNPSALHNTLFKKQKRKEMLQGARPTECDYCWNVEDNSDLYSDRIFKSSEDLSWPLADQIINSNWRDDFNPRYVEVAFSNACNFKCSYCSPTFSTQWMEEIQQYGGYDTTDKFNDLKHLAAEQKMPIPHKDYNPYVDAFWKWWPDLYRDLHTFRITGGEPLMSKDTWKVLDYIIDEKNPNKNLDFSINSNLGVPDELITKLIEKLKRITEEDKVKGFVLFTSCDAWGAQAEYIRHGLEFSRFWNNVNRILREVPRITITFMVTYNMLSVFSFDKLIKGVYDLKREYAGDDRYWLSPVLLDTSYLRHPKHQTVQILPHQFKQNIFDQAQLAFYYGIPYYSKGYVGYSDLEIQKLKRTYDWAISPIKDEELHKARYNFYKFFSEHDKRRGTNFCKTYPELEEFYNFTKTIQL